MIDEGQILNITSIDMVGFTTIGEYDPHSHQSHVCLGALEEVSVTNHFSVPSQCPQHIGAREEGVRD